MTAHDDDDATGAVAAPPRSCLAVPASSPRKLEKARTAAADAVVLDLEDAVLPPAKADARAALAAALTDPAWAPAVTVRVNAPGSAWCHLDVVALASLPLPPAALVVPKVESAGDLLFLDRLLDGVEQASGGTRRIRTHALIESARGLSSVMEIAACSERLEALVIGYADLAASLGRKAGAAGAADSWDAARHTLLTAARANGLQAIDGPHLGVRADEAFHAEAQRARELGFDGKWVIHPAQVEPLNALFSPTDEEIAWAERVIEALARAAAEDSDGAVALDGQMLDEPVRLAAVATLDRARRGAPAGW